MNWLIKMVLRRKAKMIFKAHCKYQAQTWGLENSMTDEQLNQHNAILLESTFKYNALMTVIGMIEGK